jgi:LacI family transcriptional regulator
MVTIKDVAKMAGVSPSTVSRAISGNIPVDKQTKDKVMKAVKVLDYEPNALAKSLKDGKTNTIGLIIPNIGNQLFPSLVKGVEEVARKSGYIVILCNTENNLDIEKKYLDKMKKRLVDGFIVATAEADSRHILNMKDEEIPVVLLVRHLEDKVDAVILDNFKGAYDAVTYLIIREHKKIAIINGRVELTLYNERFQGYKKALEDANLSVDNTYILDDSVGEENGYSVTVNLLKSGNIPDAIFATTDLRALGAIRAIKDFGYKVPEDISVIGFDNLEFSKLFDPQLTTVSQPLYSMGKLAMQKLIKIMNKKNKHKVIIDKMEPELIIRNSTR